MVHVRPLVAAGFVAAALVSSVSSRQGAPGSTVQGFDCVAPARPGAFEVTQPDGTTLELVLRGNGYNHWHEDLEGRPVVFAEGAWHLAELDARGRLQATSYRAGTQLPAGVTFASGVTPVAPAGPGPRDPKLDRALNQDPSSTTAPAFQAGSGSVGNLVLLLRFNGHGPGGQNRTLPSQADVTTIMNAVGGHPTLAPTGSVRDHYLENTYGALTIDSTVTAWIDVPNSETYYANGNSGLTSRTWELIEDGLDAADASIDFSQFDSDGDGWIDAITFLHSGYGAEWGGSDQYGTSQDDRMWSHKWSIPTWTSAEGIKVSEYNISPGLWSTSGSNPGRIGVVAHELGHFFGLPDEYDTDGGGQGLGNWCLMAAGSWGFDGSQQYPSHMCAWSKMKMGWIAPTQLLLGAHSLSHLEVNAEAFVLDSGYPNGEYVLIENRRQVGFDAQLPQQGLGIYHCDDAKGELGSNNVNADEGYPGQAGWPANGNHYRIALLQADDDWELEQGFNRGDSLDPYRASFATQITGTTSPNLRAYQQGNVIANDNRLTSISAPATNMTFTYANPSAPSITSASLPAATLATPYTQALSVTGGTGGKTWAEVIENPVYTEQNLGSSLFASVGSGQNWRADEGVWSYTLPFAFPFFGESYGTIYVSSNGFLDFVDSGQTNPGNQKTRLRFEHRIAPLWDDLRTDQAGDDIFVSTAIAGEVTFRWRAHHFDTGALCNFSVTLRDSGAIEFHYGSGNANVTPTVGISRGRSGGFSQPVGYDGVSSLTNANSYRFTLGGSQLPPGMQLSSAGVLSGTPTQAGSYAFVARATDGNHVFDQETVAIDVDSSVLLAGFTGAPTTGDAPLAVNFTDTSTGNVTSWSWSFGDGGGASIQNPNYVYATPGLYTVVLTVGDGSGVDTFTRTDYIAVEEPAPVADFTAAPTVGLAPLNVSFSDTTTGNVTGWSWTFGDGGSSSAQNPGHVYTTPGLYTVSLVASGPGGADTRTQTDLVLVEWPAPVGGFSGTPTSGTAPLVVAFTDGSTGNVTSYSWDFGDGNGSSAQNPNHTYTSGGTYTVALTVTGPGGSDVFTATDYVDVLDPAPVANFSGTPTSGQAPLAVAFSDLSSGPITSWSWNFGDGGSSSGQNPFWSYGTPGSFTVSLTVQGPGGSDVLTKTDYITVDADLLDPSFEGQVPATLPTTPWVLTGGLAHLVQPFLFPSDGPMPVDGSQWVELNASGSNNATPPSNPGGSTSPALGGVGISQVFRYPPGNPNLLFQAAFLRAENPDDPGRNDWMSVDVSDGLTTVNVYYKDTFSPTPTTSVIHGLPMTPIEVAGLNLETTFPSATPLTTFTVSIQVGNGGDGSVPSFGYIDDFRFLPPEGTVASGCGVNPAGSMTLLAGSPVIGTTMTFGIDNPLGTQAPGSVPILAISLGGYPSFPCGVQVPGLGMNGTGELLIRTGAFLIRPLLVGSLWSGPGNPAPVDFPIPFVPSIVGYALDVQGMLFDPSGSAVKFGLTDGYRLTFGF